MQKVQHKSMKVASLEYRVVVGVSTKVWLLLGTGVEGDELRTVAESSSSEERSMTSEEDTGAT